MLNSSTSNDSIRPNTVGVVDLHATNMAATVICLALTMSQNYYQEVSNYFGISTVKDLIHNHFQKFRISYAAADNYLCRLTFANC